MKKIGNFKDKMSMGGAANMVGRKLFGKKKLGKMKKHSA